LATACKGQGKAAVTWPEQNDNERSLEGKSFISHFLSSSIQTSLRQIAKKVIIEKIGKLF
jgi:hypothetical protein